MYLKTMELVLELSLSSTVERIEHTGQDIMALK